MDALLTALKAVAEGTRLRLLVLCAHGDLTVTDLTQILGQSQPRVSRHLKLLHDADLLDRFQEGSWAFYRLVTKGPLAELAQILVDSVPADDPIILGDLRRLEEIRQARAARAADYFRRNASKWDEIRSLYIDDALVEQHLLAALPSGQVEDLLDIGTGTGRILKVLAPHVRHALGIDLSREMLMLARSNLERAGLKHCAVRQADMYQLPLATASYDLITIHQVLHFAEAPAKVIREAGRVLRPGGKLLIIDFKAHQQAELRDSHAHCWLGFEAADIETWCQDGGLHSLATQQLPGDPLTMMIWSAVRPANESLERTAS